MFLEAISFFKEIQHFQVEIELTFFHSSKRLQTRQLKFSTAPMVEQKVGKLLVGKENTVFCWEA